MSIKPVIVYGASGYTGRLVAEYLRDRGIPFTAAGRDRGRVEAAMAAVPGIETADLDVVEVDCEVDALAAAFKDRVVACNVAGPFITHGATVAEAALRAGIHYLDTSGEQASVITCKERFGAGFAEIDRVAVPSCAYMYAPSEIAAHLALETPGTDTVDTVTLFKGMPTETSTKSIYVQLKEQAKRLVDNALVDVPATRGYEVCVPGLHETQLALDWGGCGVPVWFENDPRVRSARSLAGVLDRELMGAVLGMQQDYEASFSHLPDDEQVAELTRRANEVQASMPPRENPLVHRTVDSAQARGSLAASHVALFGTCAYRQTGLLQAAAVEHLLSGAPGRVGFASPCQAFGHAELLAALEGAGLSSVKRLY